MSDETTSVGFPVPLWAAWVVNIVSWAIFVATRVHVLEIIMGLACCFAFYVALKHKSTNLMIISALDAIWMFQWGFGVFDFDLPGF